jgi:hypothetical protein
LRLLYLAGDGMGASTRAILICKTCDIPGPAPSDIDEEHQGKSSINLETYKNEEHAATIL